MYKSIKLMSLVALLYGGSSLAYADVTCTDAPDCAALGYTQTEAQCASKPAIKCPFDTSKYYCKQTPVIEGCTVGSFLYTDGSCSSTYTSGRTLVGIVFDPIKKLAFGSIVSTGSFLMYGGLQGEYCSPAKALVDCGTDGAENSKKLFTTLSPAGSIVEANFAGGFGGLCTGMMARNIRVDWCSNISFRDYTTVSSTVWYGNGHWFIPSYKELYTIYQNKDILVSAAKEAVAAGFYLGSAQTFLSSTVNDANNLLTYYFGGTSGRSGASSRCSLYSRYGISDGLYICSSAAIIPVINYGNTEALGEFTPLKGFIIGDTNASICLYGQDNSTKVGCATYPVSNVPYDPRISIYYAADWISPKSKCGFTGYKWCDKCQNKLFRCCDYSETGCISDY